MTDQAKTILFLETGTQGGGSFVSLFQYLETRSRDAFRPVVCYLVRTPFVEKVEALGIPVFVFCDPLYVATNSPVRLCLRTVQRVIEIFMPAMRPLFDRLVHRSAAGRLAELMRSEGADLLVMNGQIDRDHFALASAEKCGVPVVSHLRSCFGQGFSPALAHRANERVSCFVANSDATRTYWASKLLHPGKMAVVYNAAPVQSEGTVNLEAEFGIPAGAPVAACIGRLIGIKGQDLLIKATAELSCEFPELRILLVGDGKEQDHFKALARSKGIEERVVFAGWRQDARELTAASSVLVVPSREEPFGRVVVEGMLAGIPVIGARVGGIPEIITNDVDGLLVGPDDVSDLRDALRRLLSDPGLCCRLTESARLTAEDKFSLPAYVAKVETIYRRAMEASE